MSGYCKTDPLSFDHKCTSFLEAVDTFDLPAKVAVTEDLGLVPVEQEGRSVFRTVVPHLKTIGCEIGSDIPDFMVR